MIQKKNYPHQKGVLEGNEPIYPDYGVGSQKIDLKNIGFWLGVTVAHINLFKIIVHTIKSCSGFKVAQVDHFRYTNTFFCILQVRASGAALLPNTLLPAEGDQFG